MGRMSRNEPGFGEEGRESSCHVGLRTALTVNASTRSPVGSLRACAALQRAVWFFAWLRDCC